MALIGKKPAGHKTGSPGEPGDEDARHVILSKVMLAPKVMLARHLTASRCLCAGL
jgi:hypothetical protein